MRALRRSIVPAVTALVLGLATAPAFAQDHKGHERGSPPAQSGAPAKGSTPPASVRTTMEALHAAGGVPPGWRFTLPPGDPAAGRRAFVELKCYACHAIRGEQFPLKPGESATAGPELTGMGGQHPAEYLAESVINPNAVLVEGPGWIGGDGRSIMPPYRDMTVGQLIDLVAYLKTLTGQEAEQAPARTQEVGPFRVRLEFRAGGEDHAHHGHGTDAGSSPGRAAPPAPAAKTGQLVVFITDRVTGQSFPYVSVFARINTSGQPRRVRLNPVLGPEGIYYMAEIAIPAEPRRIGLSVGPVSARLLPGAPEGLKQRYNVAFDWP